MNAARWWCGVTVGLLAAAPAWAAPEVTKLSWDLSLDGKVVGHRDITYTIDRSGVVPTRTLEGWTEVNASVGPVSLAFKQRLTGFADEGPMAFKSVTQENGQPYEVQARWTGDAWVVTIADKKDARTWRAADHRIDLSTVDLLDPLTRLSLGRFTSVKLLTAETGDLWEGAVVPLGPDTVAVAGKDIAVTGYAWDAPEGRTALWYDASGWLVRSQMRILGREVTAVLTTPPPASPDAFQVEIDAGPVQTSDL